MISVLFKFAGDYILVIVKGKEVYFSSTRYGIKQSKIDGLKLDRAGVIKEFPDLKDDEEWRKKAIDRFKLQISKFKEEDEIIDYVIEDLSKFGYIPLYKEKPGFRPMPIAFKGEKNERAIP